MHSDPQMTARSDSLPPGEFLGTSRLARAQPGWSAYWASYPPNLRLGSHDHERAALCIVTSGQYREQAGKDYFEAVAGTVIQQPAGNHHSDEHGSSRVTLLIVEFDNSFTERLGSVPGLLSERVMDRSPEIGRSMIRLQQELAEPDAASPVACEAILLECLAHFARWRLPPRDAAPRWLGNIQAILREPGGDMPNLTSLAAEAQLHPSHLARAFRQHCGMSIGTFRRQAMVEAARERIASTHDSLAQIAHDLGFADQSHMSRIFRKTLNMSPRDCR